MRRAIGIALVLLALAGMLLASIAEAGMLPGAAMTEMAATDCPHHQAEPVVDHSTVSGGKALAFMLCCFGVGSGVLAEATESRPVRLAALWLRPASDIVPHAGIPSPEPPPPRA
ncbi:hypothetical protein SAMN02745157_2731 [Kaistia soli DSM 19436]|uniref:DUF2946 domain-containing protein n=1 Tax=Kaistia soli DSM 19436 TaxID=1122133 RepID=A0A1M5DM54_9HYPH|nr:hypothetical protein [Kaistia soli]SHF68030.1 hypothetical protein SAMN02745157_2731 [Kaistia soli DSM 19436]